MLDQTGIYLTEVNRRYPKDAQPLGYDVLLDVDGLGRPKVISSFEMTVNSIITLLMMKPGQYPSIPELGIDVPSYLFEYADDPMTPATIREKLMDQCNRINISGVDVSVHIDRLNDGTNVLLVQITGSMFVVTGNISNRVLIGISYDKLNRIYIRKKYIERGASL